MKYDIVVIGGNPAGGTLASVAKQRYQDKSVLVIRKEPQSLIPCGIPYIFGTLESAEQDIKPITEDQNNGIKFVFDEVITVNTEDKKLSLKKGEMVEYDKLIFATGSTPFIPPIPGHTLDGVMTIRKDFEYIKSIRGPLRSAKNIVIIGAGFIGVEMSDELAKVCKNVTLIETKDTILPLAFDEDMISPVQEHLKSHGVTIKTGEMVSEIVGTNGEVSAVKLKSGEMIPADKVILSIGYRPNTSLAKSSGIDTGTFGGIVTDEYLRTNINDVFAIGDCAQHKDYFTQKQSPLMLASTASSEARIAALNLYGVNVIRYTKGSIAIFSTSIDSISMGAAGLNETQANIENIQYIVGNSKGFDKHPGKLPGTSKQVVKLLFSKGTGVIIGAQILGGSSTGEMINILGLAIQKQMTASELATMQYGTQPMLTPGPAKYPIAVASLNALRKIEN